VYWHYARGLNPYEVLLMLHLLPLEVSFARFGFTVLEEERAGAELRQSMELVLTARRVWAQP